MTPSVSAFSDVFRSSRGLVRAIALRVLHDEADADDAAQDAFVRARASLGSLRDPKALPAWIARIAHRAAVDRLRARTREARFSGVDGDEVAGGAPSPEDLVVVAETGARVRRAVRGLPPSMRRVVELRGAGCSAPEIARALGLPVGTVESRLSRAKKRLHAAIVSDCVEAPDGPRDDEASG